MQRLISPGPPLARIHAEHVRGRLWELKPSFRGIEFRFLYAQLRDGRYLILHAVIKKRRRLPAAEFALAERRLADFERRHRQ
jgi:phage-related protein